MGLLLSRLPFNDTTKRYSKTPHLTSMSFLMSLPSPDNNSFRANDQSEAVLSLSRPIVEPRGELLALLNVLLRGLAVLLVAAIISVGNI